MYTTVCLSIFLLMFIWAFHFGAIKKKVATDLFVQVIWGPMVLFV